MPGTIFETYTLEASGARDIAFSPDQTRLYVSTANGQIHVFDVATRIQIATWNIASSLGAISLSDDGLWLLAIDKTIGSRVHRINTSTGADTTFTIGGNTFIDIEVVDNQRAIITGGQNRITTLDFITGTFGTLNGGVDYSNSSIMTQSGQYILFGEQGISSGPSYIYDTVTNNFSNVGNAPGYSGYNWGIQAISSSARLVATYFYGNTFYVRDFSFNTVVTITSGYFVVGMAFSADGSALSYYLESGELVTLRTADWTITSSIFVDYSGWTNYQTTGSEVLLTSEGNYAAIRDANSGDVHLLRFGRDELLVGTAGADALAGGLGNDTYIVNNSGDTVAEGANEGFDSVFTSVSFALAVGASVEVLAADPASGTIAINLTGSNAPNAIYGNAGDNSLSGSGGNDVLIAYAGNDSLNGGTGNDTMAGGTGDDLYFVDSVSDDIVEAADEGIDTVYTSLSYGLGTGMNIERLIADSAMGAVAINLFGNELANSIYGNAAANLLRGFDGNDVLIAYAGNDVLDGGAGNDTMIGGAGDDIYFVGSVGDDVAELVGEGIDTIYASISYGLGTGASIERLIADPAIGAASINLSGNELANSIYGNGGGNLLQGFAGNDILIAYGGDDSINGGAGNDIMAGGTGDDIYFVDSVNDDVVEVAGEGTDTIYASVSYGIGTGSSIERLIADPAFGSLALINLSGNEIANSLYGNNADNILSGGDGNDTLFGYLGSDVLQGGTGNDIMVGGGGNDIYFVDSINDQVIEEGEGGYDTVYTTVSYSAGVEYLAAADRLSTSAINLTGALRMDGNNGANVISSSANGSVLSGFGGDDRLDSSFGSGTLLGGTGNDTYIVRRVDTIVEYAGEGNDTVEINDNFFALGAGISIENLRASSNVVNIALQYTGNEISNAISGGNAGDTLSGGGGDDTLDGGLGNDTLVGGIGNDVYLIGDAGDVIIEALGEGNDTALVTLSSFTLAAGLSIETIRPGMGVDNLDLAITGNELANAITGTSGANIINGGGGDDRLSGMFGNDTLTGGSGSDTFFFGTPPQQGDFDTITDFTVGVDRIGLSTAAFGTLLAGSLAASAFVIGTAALDADDRVIYNAATGALFYDADGNGAGAAIQFAVLYGAPALTAADFTIG
jgi:Ca2+-binding RTX toxin-like protein